ncbi:WD40/YVTN/BNR-like repeat-containing protein [Rariglobus hedericola]|uniref:Sortilin N-terminal domain-containing protein n=1 Tax=Rariglobus hedericola TaxID=2597822 RepID=A0A556QL08_9BACT|nr:hypothetical protein [Rariglobus hedericola]TSJ77307.1 hypothetical protein FPL22_14525 [Rariglobus hedericola]
MMIPRLLNKPHRWLLAGLCAASAPFAFAQLSPTAENATPAWTPTGWSGGGFYYSAAFHPKRDGVLFLGMDVAGVAKSTDHGKTFKMVNKGLIDYAMYSLAVDFKNPDIVYAGTEGGLHKSTDGGESWKFIPGTEKKGLHITSERGISVRSVASDPTDSNIVYAASPGGKVYKSTDGAMTWRVVYQKGVAVDTFAGLRVQFGKANGAYFGGIWSPLEFPKDATAATGIGFTLKGDGSTPEKTFINLKTSTGLSYRSRSVSEVFSDVQPRDVVFSADDFVLDPDFAKKSPDLAATAPKTPDWTTVNRIDFSRVSAPDAASVLKIARIFFAAKGADGKEAKLTVRDFNADKAVQSYGNVRLGESASAGGAVSSVVVSAQKPTRVLAATSESGLLISEDKGETWKPLATPAKAMHAAFDPANPDVIYGAFAKEGIHKSTDGGATWQKISTKLSPKFSAREIAVNPTNSKEVYAIGSDGWNGDFFYSVDAGDSWTLSRTMKTDVAVDPTTPGDGASAGLSAPTNLTINPLNPKEIFISANWRPAYSADGGRTWEERVKGADITVHTDIRFSGNRTYASAMDEGTLMSEDQGKTWKQLWPLKYDGEFSGHNWRLAVNNINGVDRIIATVSPWTGKNSTIVVISEDGGKTYKQTTAGLPTYEIKANTMWGRGYPRALAVDPSNPKIVYLGIDGDATEGKQGGGVFKSVDGGYTWKQLENQPGSRRMYYGLAIDPTNPKRIIWGGFGTNGGVYISEDGGDSWNYAFKQDQYLFNVHAAADGTLYAAGNNLWRSTDHGKTWKQITQIKGRSVVGLEIDPRNPKVMWISAVTWDGSSKGDVFKTTDGGVTWTDFTGDIQHRKPQILRFNPKTNELWSGQTMMHKIKQ